MHVIHMPPEVILGQLPLPSMKLQLEPTNEASAEHAQVTPLEYGDKKVADNSPQQPLERTDKAPPMTIKQILAQLDGVFPMDEAVVDGN